MATKTQTRDEPIRRYLQYLSDPSSIIDRDRVADLQAKLDASSDAVERLTLRQQLDEARSGDDTAVRDAFVTHAKAWADDHGVSAGAFQAEGVPRDVLADAGLIAKRGRKTRAPRSRVTADDVRKALPRKKTERVTVNSLAAKTGASVGTVRAVVKEEVEAGRLREVGSDPDHSGPGRAPILYAKAS